MKIELVKFHKNSADVTADGIEYKKLPLSETVRFGLQSETEIDEKRFAEFLEACDRTGAKDCLFAMVARGPKTEKEARIRLYQKGYRKASVDNALEIGKQYGYLSDERFAVDYVELNRASKGAYRIKAELKQKGVADEIVADAAEDLAECEADAVLPIARKLAAGKDLTDRKIKERILRNLAARGFSYDTIKDAFRSLGTDFLEEEE